MNTICVLGSLNIDNSFLLSKLPKLGETVQGIGKLTNAGGKGCNQAVSASRLGASVSFIGKVGKDKHGEQLLDILKEEGIDTSYVGLDKEAPTGEACILIQQDGNNAIIVTSGANMELNSKDVQAARSTIEKADFLISQLEVPVPAIIEAFTYAKQHNVKTVLNPAPAGEIPDELLRFTDVLIPNETEMQVITGKDSLSREDMGIAAKPLLEKGVHYVLVTLGEQGSLLCHSGGEVFVPSFKVNAVDTTAAGDSFIGAFTSKLDISRWEDVQHIREAVRFASYFSSLVVQRKGAFSSIPFADEVNYPVS
ncbi:ribokinase RbsK [Paenibacillus larvae subsp. larvae]|uniref:Ribokinase n=1 Tax=Paenibacillus larvae subsp. larvae TaxID=147375 RepID=A0A2L1UJS1_9BACL|nr:ribokinase [Paenibacillus larvae]AQT84917.1 ribokinase [Paenibacillus larvae subsp. pulvifaciens]AQZ46919.1 ribokinase [Paenibacillus larvae subsp. pulvifaciens]AVF28690.1 ribokinase RbsK [Paenibacillus larvae subsp. larvae]AVF33196.1 ribokinase RbsK [Paenibacillus larvae subsp. larvae]MBH0343046.1 ribokinase [Paenibacillus larvae]